MLDGPNHKFRADVLPMASPRRVATAHGSHMPKKYMRWKTSFGLLIPPEMRQQLTCPVGVKINLMFEVPKSYSKAKRSKALRMGVCPRGDVDNYAKSVLDAMNKITFVDDTQVMRLEVSKQYATYNSIWVSVWEL